MSVLPTCLKALQQQDYPPEAWEVIVVDDGSTDETCALVESTAANWTEQGNCPVLRLIRQEWCGAGAARNRGVNAAQAAIILFTDADCEPPAELGRVHCWSLLRIRTSLRWRADISPNRQASWPS